MVSSFEISVFTFVAIANILAMFWLGYQLGVGAERFRIVDRNVIQKMVASNSQPFDIGKLTARIEDLKMNRETARILLKQTYQFLSDSLGEHQNIDLEDRIRKFLEIT